MKSFHAHFDGTFIVPDEPVNLPIGKTIELEIVTMTNKKLLIRGAAERVRLLLVQGCERVVVLWDENPPWSPEADFAEERCWHTERDFRSGSPR